MRDDEIDDREEEAPEKWGRGRQPPPPWEVISSFY